MHGTVCQGVVGPPAQDTTTLGVLVIFSKSPLYALSCLPLPRCTLILRNQVQGRGNNLSPVIDADGEGWSDETTLKHILSMRPKAVGMSVTSGTKQLCERWGAMLKREAQPSPLRVVLGGPEASMDPRGVLTSCPSADAVVRGEAEVIFPELVDRLLEDMPLQGLRGVLERSQEGPELPELLRVPKGGFPSLPFPALNDLPVHRYWCPDAVRSPMVTFHSTRGCPFKCGFCASPELLGKKVRE